MPDGNIDTWMSRLSQNACDNRGTHYRIENKRAMTLIAEMVLIVIVSFTDHVAVLYDDDNNNFYLWSSELLRQNFIGFGAFNTYGLSLWVLHANHFIYSLLSNPINLRELNCNRYTILDNNY